MIVRCLFCKFEREVKDNVILPLCPVCLNKMEMVDDGKDKFNKS
jgi:Zn finger protein HypA/HybF involved in hydrogenase expression